MKARLFEPWEDDFLREVGDALSPGYIGKVLGRSTGSVKGRIGRLGIEINQSLMEARIAASRIQKGQISHNKGKKGYCAPGSEKGWFKKGDVSKRWLNSNFKDGDLSLRMDHRGVWNWFIRLKQGEWVHFSREVWVLYNGPIPTGFIVKFVDGDTLNCAPRNLRLVSLRENRLENSASKNLPDGYVAFVMAGKNRPDLKETFKNHPDLIEVGRQSIILKRTIRNGK